MSHFAALMLLLSAANQRRQLGLKMLFKNKMIQQNDK